MPIFANNELSELMESFYTLTGIRIALFDENYSEIISYPKNETGLCSVMRKNPEFYKRCCECDKISFIKCKKNQTLTVYKCHAGLIEATAPITENGITIGYIMFGQIADKSNRESFAEEMLHYCNGFSPEVQVEELIRKIKHKSTKQIMASSNILLACTSYILLKQMIKPSRRKIFSDIDTYISNNLCEDLRVEALCTRFNISRTKLYEIMNPYISGGIATYVKEKRLSAARSMLLNTKKAISQIASETGFSDYNYFIHVFKSYYGISPKQIRKREEA